jgi:hypothetical protein
MLAAISLLVWWCARQRQAPSSERPGDALQLSGHPAMLALVPLTLVLLTCSAGPGYPATDRSWTSRQREALPPIQVAVLTAPNVSQSLVNGIFAETQAIWGPAGIRFEWHRMASEDASRPFRLEVTIDDRRNSVSERQVALGWTRFRGDRPEPSIHLSRSSAEEMLHVAAGLDNGTIAMHEALIGRALGRALSHELGHYLLKSKAHTARGLMRANWPSDEPFAIARRGFELTAQEQETAAQHVHEDAK